MTNATDNTFYASLKTDEEIGQGDIFNNIPFLDLESTKVTQTVEIEGGIGYKEFDINSYVPDEKGEISNCMASVLLRPGIVITQNCDVLRSDYISFCEIKKFEQIEKNFSPVDNKKRIEFLTKTYKDQAKYFYLPVQVGFFPDKMAVDFSRIYQIRKSILGTMIDRRAGRLCDLALTHFRSKLGHYFKRFAYDGWYLLDKDEYSIFVDQIVPTKYSKEEQDRINPYPWHI